MGNHPDLVPANRSLVVATLKRSSSATFKQLVIDGMYIQPLNPNRYEKIIKIDESAVINGVVLGNGRGYLINDRIHREHDKTVCNRLN